MWWWLVLLAAPVVAMDWGPVWVSLAGGAGVALTALLSWAMARRRESGSTETSDAATLWSASETIRLEQREEIVRLRERVAVLEDQGARDQERIGELEKEVRRLGGLVNGTS